MARGLRDIRTMRDVWDRRRKASTPRRPARASIVRRFASPGGAERPQPPKGTVPARTWVFSRTPAASSDERRLLVKRATTPEVDLFDEDDELIVLADLPGVSAEDVELRVAKDLVIIEAASAGHRGKVHYHAEALLPYDVDDHCTHSCRNGVLEIHLRPRRQDHESNEAEGQPKPQARAREGREQTP